MATRNLQLVATCRCGRVRLAAVGRPIAGVACYCASCQATGRRFEQLPSAPALLHPDGGTACLLYRKDRVRSLSGQADLREDRLNPQSPTRRVVATRCNSAMFLDFTKGHWLTMYRGRFPAMAPPVEMRIMTHDRRGGPALADDLPNSPDHAGRIMLKLWLPGSRWASAGRASTGDPLAPARPPHDA